MNDAEVKHLLRGENLKVSNNLRLFIYMSNGYMHIVVLCVCLENICAEKQRTGIEYVLVLILKKLL